jgi:riboflavin kinase/FMN adenylyltransferase
MTILQGSWRDWDWPGGRTSLTIGVLDGVHRGHRQLLSHLDPHLTRTVLTFEPHPIEVLRPGTPPRLLTTVEERATLLFDAGVELLGVLDLAEIKDQSPVDFVDDVLLGKLDMGHLVVGEGFRFGKDRTGDVDLLTDRAGATGFDLEVIPILDSGGEPISSSRIRALVEDGDVGTAATLLGSRFTLTNEVVDGDRRGRELGFPTANLRPPDRKVVPGHGVYACLATVLDSTRQAAVNVGVRPTFGGGEVLVEAYLIDFEGDLYGNELTLEFVQYLRPEITFDGVDPLIAQMDEDVARARRILGGVESPNMS